MKRYRTIKQIMEDYLPAERQPKTGEELGREIAKELLAQFRESLRARR